MGRLIKKRAIVIYLFPLFPGGLVGLRLARRSVAGRVRLGGNTHVLPDLLNSFGDHLALRASTLRRSPRAFAPARPPSPIACRPCCPHPPRPPDSSPAAPSPPAAVPEGALLDLALGPHFGRTARDAEYSRVGEQAATLIVPVRTSTCRSAKAKRPLCG